MSEQLKVELQEWMGGDRQVAEAAWTSSLDYSGKEKRSDADVERLVKMLIENKHSTPVESVVLRFWIKMSIAVDRQFMTHRLQSASGMSGRYRTMPNEWQNTPPDVANIVRQGVGSLTNNEGLADYMVHKYETLCQDANSWYRESLKQLKEAETKGFITNSQYKRVREFFRGVLPQNNMTERVSIMNLRAFSNFIKLRNSEHAQPEIRRIAQLMLEQVKLKGVAPITVQQLELKGWNI